MITDLLVVGLLVAAAPDLPIVGAIKPPTPEQRSEETTGAGACHKAAGPGSRAALLEAHASFAALPPFSLARVGAGSSGANESKDTGGCKS